MANERAVRILQVVIAAAVVATAIPIIPSLLQKDAPLPKVDAAMQESEPGRIAVDLKDNLSNADFADLNADYGLSLDLNSVYSDRQKLYIDDVEPADVDSLLERLRKDPRVEAAS